MAPGVIQAGITGGSGLLGTGIQAISTAIQNKKARKWALQDWNRQNEYNHPSAQMARLREAGLNPNLIYGSGTQAATGMASRGANPAQFQPQSFEIGSGISQAVSGGLGAYYDTQVKEAQIDNLRQQNTLIINQAALAAQKSLESITNIEQKKAQSESTRWLTERSKGMYGTQLQVLEENLRNLSSSTALKTQQKDYLIAKNVRESSYLDSQLKSMALSRNVDRQRILNMIAEYVKTGQQTVNLMADNRLIQEKANTEEGRQAIQRIQEELLRFKAGTQGSDKVKDYIIDFLRTFFKPV